jgi:UDP-N-acetylglucosamine-lysosomal-enzyme
MIDKDIMEELQSKWPNEWNATASHRLRSGQDMQYAFAYFYYLIHARVEYNLTNVWQVELGIHDLHCPFLSLI